MRRKQSNVLENTRKHGLNGKGQNYIMSWSTFFHVNSNLLPHTYKMERTYILSVTFFIVSSHNKTQRFGNYLLPFSGEITLTSNQINHHNINNYSEYSKTLCGVM
jgi:hypothetical protein